MPRKNQMKSMWGSSVEMVADVLKCSVKERTEQGNAPGSCGGFPPALPVAPGSGRVNFFPQSIHDHTANSSCRCGACRLRMRVAAGPARFRRHPFRAEAGGLFPGALHAAACGTGLLQFLAIRRAGIRCRPDQAGTARTRQCAHGRGRRYPRPGGQGAGRGPRAVCRKGDGACGSRAEYHACPQGHRRS